MRQLQWGVAWLENWLLRDEVKRDSHVSSQRWPCRTSGSGHPPRLSLPCSPHVWAATG
jgi:hypothetical protein